MKTMIVNASELGTDWLWPIKQMRAEARRESAEYAAQLRPRPLKLTDAQWDQLKALAEAAGVEPRALVASWIAKKEA